MGFFDRCELGIFSMLLGGAFLISSSMTSIWLTIPGAIFFFLGVVLFDTGLNKLRVNIDFLENKVEILESKIYRISNSLYKIEKNLRDIEISNAMKTISKEDEDKFFPEEK